MLESGNFISPEEKTINALPKKEKPTKPAREESLEQTMPGPSPEEFKTKPNEADLEKTAPGLPPEKMAAKHQEEIENLEKTLPGSEEPKKHKERTPTREAPMFGQLIHEQKKGKTEPSEGYVKSPLSSEKVTDPNEIARIEKENIERTRKAIKAKVMADGDVNAGLLEMMPELSQEEKRDLEKSIQTEKIGLKKDVEYKGIQKKDKYGIPDESGTVHLITKPEYTQETGIKPSKVKGPIRRFWDRLRGKK